eukprot:1153532-Pelagomonas_calceolata.AAC.11
MDDIRRVESGACGLGAGHGVHFMCQHYCGSKGYSTGFCLHNCGQQLYLVCRLLLCSAGSCWAWLSLVEKLTVLTLLAAEGLELQSFSYHPALFLDAGLVFFLCLPYFTQSELSGGGGHTV